MAKRPPKRVAESLSDLVKSIGEEGMVAVAKRPNLSTLDKGLLKVLANLGGLKGSEDLLEVLKANPELLETTQTKKYKITSLKLSRGAKTKSASKPNTKEEKLS